METVSGFLKDVMMVMLLTVMVAHQIVKYSHLLIVQAREKNHRDVYTIN